MGFIVGGEEESCKGSFVVGVLAGGLEGEAFGGCVVELGGCQWGEGHGEIDWDCIDWRDLEMQLRG